MATPGAAEAIGQAGYWVHVFLVFAFLNYLPYGKHFHVITSLPNVVTRSLDAPGHLKPMAKTADALMEKMSEGMSMADPMAAPVGVGRMDHFTWKSLLDFYTCTECGRCSDNCPAHRTGKLLSPKHLTIDLRDHLYEQQDAVMKGLPAAPAKPAEGEEAAPEVASLFPTNLVPDVIHPDVIWACTSCRACEEQCPVMITYVDKIVDMRRNLVMVRGEFPAELQRVFTALETNGNPWNITRQDRAEWTAGLDVPTMAETPDADVLYWVGCAASYDDRAKKIARAMVRLLKQAGVKFAILGTEETCTGDPARRAGNEHLFLMLAEQNVATLNNYKPEEDRHDLPALLQHPAQRVPRLRREVRSGAPHRLPHGPARGEEARARAGREGQGRLPRLVLPGPLQQRLRAPARDLQAHPRRRARRGRVEPREGPLLRRRRRADVDGGAARHRAREQAPHAAAPRHGRDVVASGCPFCQTMLTDGINGMGDDLKRPVEQLDVAEMLERSVDFDAAPVGAPRAKASDEAAQASA